MAYTTIKKPSDYFNTVLYTGDDSSNRGITGVGFQPDLVWNKTRNQAFNHYLFDSVRGAGQLIFPNDSAAEQDKSAEFISFDSNGFTITQNAGSLGINWSSGNYANWCWKAGGTGVSNTDGSITSTVSANTTSGFSIVKYTGTGADMTVGHGLNAVPKMIIVKALDTGTDPWWVYHASLGNSAKLRFNETNASSTTADYIWNQTTPTSSVFSLDGANNGSNANGNNFIAYCFADVKGFSKFGSYTGNGNADGTFCYTGFKPAFVIMKRTDTSASWFMKDNKRDPFNPAEQTLAPDSASSEAGWGTGDDIDLLSNGFKMKDNSTYINASGGSYIYMAFAEEPLVGDNPATAR
jgi:hypothetical protein